MTKIPILVIQETGGETLLLQKKFIVNEISLLRGQSVLSLQNDTVSFPLGILATFSFVV